MTASANPSAAPLPKWTTVSWKRVALALFLSFGVMGAVSLLMEFIEPWYVMRQSLRDSPQLNIVPAYLRDVSVSPLASARLECYGYSFQVPWTPEGRREYSSFAGFWFRGGITITAHDPASNTSLAQNTRKNMKQFEPEFGSEVLRSDYDWTNAELEATSADLHFWHRRHNVRAAAFLGEKEAEVAERQAIYRINSGELKGFQIGDPSRDWRVTLELFDSQDRQYKLEFMTQNKGAANLTQADINAIVASLRPIPHS